MCSRGHSTALAQSGMSRPLLQYAVQKAAAACRAEGLAQLRLGWQGWHSGRRLVMHWCSPQRGRQWQHVKQKIWRSCGSVNRLTEPQLAGLAQRSQKDYVSMQCAAQQAAAGCHVCLTGPLISLFCSVDKYTKQVAMRDAAASVGHRCACWPEAALQYLLVRFWVRLSAELWKYLLVWSENATWCIVLAGPLLCSTCC